MTGQLKSVQCDWPAQECAVWDSVTALASSRVCRVGQCDWPAQECAGWDSVTDQLKSVQGGTV